MLRFAGSLVAGLVTLFVIFYGLSLAIQPLTERFEAPPPGSPDFLAAEARPPEIALPKASVPVVTIETDVASSPNRRACSAALRYSSPPHEALVLGPDGCFIGARDDYVPRSDTLDGPTLRALSTLFSEGRYGVTDPEPGLSACELASLTLTRAERDGEDIALWFSDGCGCTSRGNAARLVDAGAKLEIFRFCGVNESFSLR